MFVFQSQKSLMTEPKRIPYAVADYDELRSKNFYYIDKTFFIPDLEEYKAPVFLRPRRFGKSLFISTLACYYDINRTDRFEALFGDTNIGQHPTAERNSFMVLRLDFSKLSMADTAEGLERNFHDMVCPVLYELAKEEKRYLRYFADLHFEDTTDASKMLSQITSRIQVRELPKLYILIDEYDNFTNQLLTTFRDPLYEQVTTGDSFLRTFFKVIKAGIGEGSIVRCFCTGVLPVTMDDLTSGFNIANIITLNKRFLNMMGFTHHEASEYLRYVIDHYDTHDGDYDELWQMIISNYDGYRFLPDADPLFNSTILTYFFQSFVDSEGEIPRELVDENLRTDINWIRRLTLTQENAKAMLDELLVDNEMIYSENLLSSKFNKQRFFDKRFYPVSLYYLGMTTLKNEFLMCLPNLTMKSIFMDYYNDINGIADCVEHYVPVFMDFFRNGDLLTVFNVYFEQYLGQFPAQVFDKINENFVRCSFYELCSRYMRGRFTFALEQNRPSGRADFVMTGIPGTSYHNDCRVVEFKYFKIKDAAIVESLTEARAEDIRQVQAYAADINRSFPNYRMSTYVVYIAAGKVCRAYRCENGRWP